MNPFKLEHDKAVHLSYLLIHGVATTALAALLIGLCPSGQRLYSLILAALGLLVWALLEYLLHRLALHGLHPFRHWNRGHGPAALIGVTSLLGVLVFLPMVLLVEVRHAGAFSLGLLAGYLAYSLPHRPLNQRPPLRRGPGGAGSGRPARARGTSNRR